MTLETSAPLPTRPRTSARRAASSPGGAPGQVTDARPLDILLVEDEPDILEVLTELLVRQGHCVTAVADGAKAMACLDRRSYDVAICDVRVPHVDGLRIFRRIRSESPRSQVILMSAYGSVAEAVGAMKDDAAHYLAKPFDTDVLVGLLDRIQQHRQLERDLRGGAGGGETATALLGTSPGMVRLRGLIGTIAASDAAVMLTGESGTGKELVAREIHRLSPRAQQPFVAVNCAAFPATLLEAELFGHEKGAYTGALRRRDGRFGAANGGTLFLDEVGEMPPSAQAKLLRVLEDGCYQRLGSNELISVDVRLISATNTDVQRALEEGTLREDIYHRLKVFHLHLPALRQRPSDIPLLIRHFHAAQVGRAVAPLQVSPRAWAALRHYDYPGNVRELKHVIEHALVLGGGEQIDLCHLPDELRGDASPASESGLASLNRAVAEFEREYLLRALRRCNWQKAKTAKFLGVSRKTLWHKLKQHDIER